MTSSDDIEKINQIVLDGVSDNIVVLVKTGKYVTMNTTDTNTMGYYFIKFLSEYYTPQEYTACDEQINKAGKLAVKLQYIKYMQD